LLKQNKDRPGGRALTDSLASALRPASPASRDGPAYARQAGTGVADRHSNGISPYP